MKGKKPLNVSRPKLCLAETFSAILCHHSKVSFSLFWSFQLQCTKWEKPIDHNFILPLLSYPWGSLINIFKNKVVPLLWNKAGLLMHVRWRVLTNRSALFQKIVLIYSKILFRDCLLDFANVKNILGQLLWLSGRSLTSNTYSSNPVIVELYLLSSFLKTWK